MSPSPMKTLIMNLAKRARTIYATLTVKGAANVLSMTTNTSFTARAKTPFSRV